MPVKMSQYKRLGTAVFSQIMVFLPFCLLFPGSSCESSLSPMSGVVKSTFARVDQYVFMCWQSYGRTGIMGSQFT